MKVRQKTAKFHLKTLNNLLFTHIFFKKNSLKLQRFIINNDRSAHD